MFIGGGSWYCPSWLNPLELCSDHFPGLLYWPGGVNKDHTVWLDEARPLPKYIFKIMLV